MISLFRFVCLVGCVLLAAEVSCAQVQAPALTPVAPTAPTPSLAPMVAKVVPGVVSIGVRGKVANQKNQFTANPLFRHFFGGREFQAAGSGVVVDASRGYILTNNHVVEGADEITVSLNDGRHLTANKIGADPTTDLAVVQVAADHLTGLPLGDSDALKAGDYVVAVGNPFTLSQTVTFGIVSALGRAGLGIEGYENFIQTDASINPGNSGGALVNLKGEVVGINTAIVGPANVGIGFAIPINMARGVMGQLIAHGEIKRGQLGVTIEDMTPDLAKTLNVAAGTGAVVTDVAQGSPAEMAGVKPGDVIVKVNGEAISGASGLRNKIALLPVGSKLDLTVIREGAPLELTAFLAEAKAEKKASK